MKRRTFVKSAGAAPAGLFFGNRSRKGPVRVETESGEVEGSRLDSGVREWLGIPYAHQPVGDLRWRPPRTPAPEFDGVLDATEYGPECIQSSVFGQRGEESCLNLNVWAPGDVSRWGGKPVMVWVHGGAYDIGSNRYDSRFIAEEGDVVVVAVNYRLNAMGFFAHPELTAEDPRNVNQGYQDIRAALGWVQRNVREFGGDPDNVTVFGESAGGHAVQLLMTDPDAEGLFHRAISQSGPGADPLFTMEEREDIGVAIAEHLGCSGSNPVDCMRGKTASEILAAYSAVAGGFFGGGPVSAAEPALPITVDGTVVEEHPAKRFRDGEFHDVPFLLGGNKDEAQFFLALGFRPSTQQEYELAVQARYPDHYEEVLERYPASDFGAPIDALEKVSTDQTFLCADAAVAEWVTGNGGEAYRYIFDDVPTTPAPFILFQDTEVGAYHTAELLYVFGTEIGQSGVTLGSLGPDDQKLARTMRAYWTGFAEYGRPTTFSFDDLLSWFKDGGNDTYREFWPRYGGKDWRVRFEQDGVTRERGTRPECRFWRDYYEDVLPL